MTSPAAAVAAAYHGSACGHAARLTARRTKPRRCWYCCRQPTITPSPFPATANFRAEECTRLLCCVTLPHQNKPQVGCTRLAAVRLIAECADVFPLVFDCPHICCLHDQPSEVKCVRQVKTKINAVRLKKPLQLRTARVPTIELSSRGFG